MSQLSYPLATAKLASSGQLMSALLNGEKLPSKCWEKTSFRLKFLCRSLLCWPTTRALLNTLVANPLLDEILSAQPDLPCKLHRPYLAANMNRMESLFALRDHYDLIAQRMPIKVCLGYLSNSFTLGCAEDKNGGQIHLQLTSIGKLSKEGEATLLMRNAQGVMLAEITFTLMNYHQQPTLFIGGLQGAEQGVPHSEIQNTTKACHGLFPKRLALEGVTYLAHHLGIQQIIAVGNTTHVYQNWRYSHKKKDVLHADYDQFWLSMGGKQLDHGYFLLPARIARKSLEDIASKKRAEYRRRYQLLDELQQGFAVHFNAAPNPLT
ncbi:VirK/YbjX family protein [Serratia sp. UGAL515B_01]|uniref:VirK/YbjX family protein n=1 Tax=Serratia sp. UGAL515B_01 TaxID=2986763 RepID=UPI002953CAAC|nr:VirK/YbjX family protein [Serratia sp. UGAL515B_01]WON78177.1 VirK/YbjX family protein [Serratia sp. UGAL515B_01]